MNETELRQAVESMRDQIAALSGRIDGMDRGEILRAVKDDRRDKLSERHAQAFGRHAGDAVPHTYRDYLNPHRIPGMVEVRPYEDAAAGFVADVAELELQTTFSALTPTYSKVPLSVSSAETDDAVLDVDAANNAIIVKATGWYWVSIYGLFDIGPGAIPSDLANMSFALKADTLATGTSFRVEWSSLQGTYDPLYIGQHRKTASASRPKYLEAGTTVYLWAYRYASASLANDDLVEARLSLVRIR